VKIEEQEIKAEEVIKVEPAKSTRRSLRGRGK
jgi:hypothetical protein